MRHRAPDVTPKKKRHGMVQSPLCVCVRLHVCEHGSSIFSVIWVHTDKHANSLQCVLRQGERV